MSSLIEYLREHANQCHPDEGDVDVIFFGVKCGPDATADEFRSVLAQHEGVFGPCDLFDGAEHNYIELGGWIGDQGAALTLMGLGAKLGVWKLLTPKTVMGKDFPDDVAMKLAELGMITIQAKT